MFYHNFFIAPIYREEIDVMILLSDLIPQLEYQVNLRKKMLDIISNGYFYDREQIENVEKKYILYNKL